MLGEAKMARQQQEGGDQSTNLQAENINITGLSYAEAREVALDVFKANFLELSELASSVARKRAEEITNKFLDQLKTQNKDGVQKAQDPDFQHALFTVQKEFARTGDEDLGDLLVDLLVDRTKHDNRTILQIVLNESLSVAPKLTKDQLAALSIIFIFRYTINKGINGIDALSHYLKQYIAPHAGLLSKNNACYQHLEFSGCGSISIGSTNLSEIFRNNYTGVLSKGFTAEDLENSKVSTPLDSPIFTKCLHDTTKFQVNAITEDILRNEAQKLNIDEEETNRLISFNKSFLMSPSETKEYLTDLHPFLANVFEVWEDSPMKNTSLTSVGIAIGHANVKRQIGEFTDLSIWIN